MTSTTELTEREYFALFAARTGLFLGRPSASGVVGFLNGYDEAALRYGRPGLTGWREWLIANHRSARNLVWSAQVMNIAVPVGDSEPTLSMSELSPDQEDRFLTVLFELLDDFLAERERAGAPESG